jgi:hypothetical protein
MSDDFKRPGKRPPVAEKMKTVTFQIKPSDYQAAQEMFESMGLSTGAGIRLAIMELMRGRKGK